MTIPPIGTPVGLEIPAKDVSRGSAFYSAVFNWTFARSTIGIPEDKLLTFTVPGDVFPIGGAMRRGDTQDLTSTPRAKLYLYVEDVAAAMETIKKNGGKETSEMMTEGSKGFFQFFEDTEGNNLAIYTYAK